MGATLLSAILIAPGCGVTGDPSATKAGKQNATAMAQGRPGTAARKGTNQTRSVSSPGPVAPVVVIDPGHNGMNWAHMYEMNKLVDAGGGKMGHCSTAGTTSLHGYTEAAYVFDLATRLVPLLKSEGVTVILTRPDNAGWGPCIDERAAVANQAHARLSVSIHGEGWPVGRGFHALYPAPIPGVSDAVRTGSERLALDVRQAFAQGTGMPYATYTGTQGLSPDPGPTLYQVPHILIETANMRSPVDATLIDDPGFREREAQALAAGIKAYLDGG